MVNGLQPLRDNILVKDHIEAKTDGGIFLPDQALKKMPQRGTVVAVGPGELVDGARRPLDVSVGDEVVFVKYAGAVINTHGETYRIMQAREVMAVIERVIGG